MDKRSNHIILTYLEFVTIFFFATFVSCGKEKEKPAKASLPDTAIYQKYEREAIIVLPSEVLDTAIITAMLSKPENRGKVFTSFKRSFALVTPIKWDGISALLDDVAYELTEEQMLKVERNSSPPEFVRLQRMKADVDSNKGATGHYKTIAYKQGGGVIIVGTKK